MEWQVRSKAPDKFFKQFPEFSPLVVQLLYNRGLRDQKQVDEFFNPDFGQDINDPYLLKGIKKAAQRIIEAVDKKEKIVIYGDFDADGVCSAAILYLTLKELEHKNLDVYIPDREKENHGLNENSVRGLAQSGAKLIIAVDCASNDSEEVDLANSLGIETIIVDHHELDRKMVKALALVNPLQKGDKYPFKELSGAGVVYKLTCVLIEESRLSKDFSKWLLDLVAVATVADVMPIIGENRTLVKYGLGVLAQTRWPGLAELMRTAQIDPRVTQFSSNGEAPLTNLDIYTLSHILGPRLNAAGRMDHANVAFELLITENRKRAIELAQNINQSNQDRQNLTDKIYQEIVRQLDKKFNRGDIPELIFEGSPDWPVGLIGLIASKIAERYNRPAVIYYENETEVRASCRSSEKLDWMEVFKKSDLSFEDFGGRTGTGGFVIEKSELDRTRESLKKVIKKELGGRDLTPILDIDAELFLDDINWSNYEQIQEFSPFGRANPRPRFLIRSLEIRDLKVVGSNGGHLKLDLLCFGRDSSSARTIKAIAFGMGHLDGILKRGNSVDVVFELVANQWNGFKDLEMKVVDLKLSGE